jgi:hypothetical protein
MLSRYYLLAPAAGTGATSIAPAVRCRAESLTHGVPQPIAAGSAKAEQERTPTGRPPS